MTDDARSATPDPQIEQVLDQLSEYKRAHANAQVEACRSTYDFIHIRIIDPDFRGVDELDREAEIWPLLNQLPREVYRELMMLVLVTPEEAAYSGSSLEFDDLLSPMEMPDLSTEGRNESTIFAPTNGTSTLLLPLENEEVEAVQQIADSKGIESSILILDWVREKLKMANVA